MLTSEGPLAGSQFQTHTPRAALKWIGRPITKSTVNVTQDTEVYRIYAGQELCTGKQIALYSIYVHSSNGGSLQVEGTGAHTCTCPYSPHPTARALFLLDSNVTLPHLLKPKVKG